MSVKAPGLMSVFLCSLLVSLFGGCSEITEFENLASCTLTIYSQDFTVLKQIQGIEEARSLVVYPGLVFILRGNGYIDKYDSETLELIGSYPIGQSSPTGYSNVTYCSSKGSIYVVGALGNIIEVSVPDCQVVDDFSICPWPSMLSVSRTSPAYLYVVEGSSSKLWAVKCSSNSTVGSWTSSSGIVSVEASDSDTTLLSTDMGTYMMEFQTGGGFTSRYLQYSTYLDMEYSQWYHHFAVVGAESIGLIGIVIDPVTLLPIMETIDSQPIEGAGHLLSCDDDRYAFLASYMGENIIRMVKYDMALYTISELFETSGIPIDMEVSGSGLIYLLSMEDY